MRLVPLGDAALLAELGGQPDDKVAAAVRRLAGGLLAAPLRGVEAIVPAFTTVAVHYVPVEIPGAGDPAATVASWIGRVWAKGGSSAALKPKDVVLPVVYGGDHGPDLEEVAKACGLTPAEVIRRHARSSYEVRAVGFSPGFPYLAGLPPALRVPRRATPRTKVPAGSVAIGGAQTGVYPSATPGGWNLIGRTPRVLFDPSVASPSLLRPGDRVKFAVVTEEDYARQAAAVRPPAMPAAQTHDPTFTVLRPGVLTTVQDLGRTGFQDVGVSPGGAIDSRALQVANLLVGNLGGEAGLECTLRGPLLAVRKDAWIAITGARVAGLPWARPFRVKAGEEISLETIEHGCRAYVAVAGGVDVPAMLGSRSTLLAAGLGGFEGRALKAGDRIGTRADAAHAKVSPGWFAAPSLAPVPTEDVTVRVVRGPQAEWFSPAAWQTFLGTPYRVNPKSDRMGARLDGAALTLLSARELVSEAVATGSVQVPPDGQPIVLLAERQTIGGYPKIANVITVDLGRMAQARPGSVVRFAEVTIDEARRLLGAAGRDLAWFRLGIGQKEREHGAR
ncbi:MAG TPA: 5-oxoprolinase subunit PxpB [Opitutaceae bacterium]